MSEHRRAKLTSYVEIADERAEWLWSPRVPLGAVTLLAGQPGLGKSQVSLYLAARLTRGELACGPGAAIVATAEDHRAAVIRPRLRAAQADLDHVFDIRVSRLDDIGGEDALLLPLDVRELEASIEETAAKLVVLDPLVSFLDGRVGLVERRLRPAGAGAARRGCRAPALFYPLDRPPEQGAVR